MVRLRNTLLVLAMAGMLMPAYAPLLGNGWVEMLPSHHHLFVGSGTVAHGSGESGGMLSVPGASDEGTFAVVASLAVAAVVTALLVGAHGVLTAVGAGSRLRLSSATIVPAAPPPKSRISL